MHIAVDLDNTLVHLDPIATVIGRLRHGPRDISARDCKNWAMTDIPVDIRAKVNALFADPDYMCSLQPLPGAREKIAEWTADGHDVSIVTCRAENIAEATRDMIEKLFPWADSIIIPGSSKYPVYSSCPIDLVIDDSPIHIAEALAAGIPRVVMISNADTPYNHCMLGAKGIENLPDIVPVRLGDFPPESACQEADRLTSGDRQNTYGHPLDDFTRTGRIWGAILGRDDVTPEQVALCMAAVKISRECNLPKRDNRVDGAGYFNCLEMIHQERTRRAAEETPRDRSQSE